MSTSTTAAAAESEFHDDIIYPGTVPFLLVHLASFAAIWTWVTLQAVAVAVGLYLVRMFAITAGFHRYFSHRSYKTSRVGQFLLAALGQTSAQRGVLWWASKHRHHHLHSDTEEDVHSPRHRGFLYSHVGWIFTRQHQDADYSNISDFTKYPELVWLDRHPYFMAGLMALAIFLLMGWTGLVVGFIWSTVALYHGTFMINSLAHVLGSQRYVTGDDSRNNWWLALITYYLLKALSWVGIVWDLRDPPEEVVENRQPLGRKVIERVAHDVAASFPPERLAALPSLEQVRARTREMWEQVPRVSLDDVAERARELLAESVSSHLVETA